MIPTGQGTLSLMLIRFTLIFAVVLTLCALPSRADTIGITFSNAGAETSAPVLIGTILNVNAQATGSILSFNPAFNALWNPVTFNTHDAIDITTGINNGNFSITFADGDTLFGTILENDAALLATGSGPFTQTLTFTGGTGEFTGASGFLSGSGVSGPAGFTASGNGILTAAGVITPEPASVSLIFAGLLVVLGVVSARLRNLV
jgi:hypothetical protein